MTFLCTKHEYQYNFKTIVKFFQPPKTTINTIVFLFIYIIYYPGLVFYLFVAKIKKLKKN